MGRCASQTRPDDGGKCVHSEARRRDGGDPNVPRSPRRPTQRRVCREAATSVSRIHPTGFLGDGERPVSTPVNPGPDDPATSAHTADRKEPDPPILSPTDLSRNPPRIAFPTKSHCRIRMKTPTRRSRTTLRSFESGPETNQQAENLQGIAYRSLAGRRLIYRAARSRTGLSADGHA